MTGFEFDLRRAATRLGIIGLATTCGLLSTTVALPVTTTSALVEDEDGRTLSEDIRVYTEHLTILASPFMEGRLPGTRGMEIAKEYVEHYFKEYGLEPAFPVPNSEGRSYRQAFELGGTTSMIDQRLAVEAAGSVTEFAADRDFTLTGMGADGNVSGELAFVGYSINEGPDGYSSFSEDDDLSGKVAVMLRFEPMDENGDSLWATRGPWSAAAGFAVKLRAIADRNPAAVIIVNTPGANDSRINRLISDGVRITEDFPVFMMTGDAGSKLVRAANPQGPSLTELRDKANTAGGVVSLGGRAALGGTIENIPVFAENVGGLLPGKGSLANEYIVVGGHLDHLGMGDFGSRSGPGELHPGADDNASGVVAVMMMAEALAAEYETLPDDANRRSVLFVGFDAEESGLNGSQHYVSEPIAPLEDHMMMINFDMIGRVINNRVRISGTGSGEGLEDWLAPIAERSKLDVQMSARSIGGSDHLPFMRNQIPYLFGSIDGLHDDYHTPRDTSDKINFEDATHTTRLFSDILSTAAAHEGRFAFAEQARGNRGGGNNFMSRLKVRLGIRPDRSGQEVDNGILIGSVTEGGTAAEGGIMEGDILTMWNKEDVSDMQGLLLLMAEHEPGDKVRVKVIRDGEEQWLELTLQGRG